MNTSDFLSMLQNSELTKITMKAIVITAIFIATMILANLTKRFVQRKIDRSKADITQLSFIKHVLLGAIYFIGFAMMIYQIDYLKSISVSILASSGIMAVVVGFASQQTFANLVSGLFISFFKPFRIGDRIRFIDRETMGIVEDITLRHTVLRTYENKHIIIPNNIMNNELIENANIVEDKICTYLNVGISYDSDINKAMRIIQEEVIRHEDYYDNRTKEEVQSGTEPVAIKVLELGESSVNLRAWVWAKDPLTGFMMNCDLNKRVKERFDREGIEIPFPYRTIVFKNKAEKEFIKSN